MTKTYILTAEELEEILNCSVLVPYIIVGGYAPMSPQEKADRFWQRMGEKYGFKWETVQAGENDRVFTAETKTDGGNHVSL